MGKCGQGGYIESRPEISALATVRYRPWSRVGLAADLRGMYYNKFTPLIPAAFLDVTLWPRYGLMFKLLSPATTATLR
ncbi:hypothetical protein [Bacteroides reticulotermitis]|uniref:TonB-dependent receptor n=1 Tax=Bacteroides reticulotermitis JCM 10512 TaxID=1445607 RepID=W4UYS7_9BACE|nr:hypothetical protein [Bacteroides reticulotermitis]GAE85639.1 hypothetical protein JCM10512_4089 [Bacteroides reticulotermitis JCM 10512]